MEIVGKVASGAIDAMKASPALLALILLQTLVFGLLYLNQQSRNAQQHEREMAILERCFPKG